MHIYIYIYLYLYTHRKGLYVGPRLLEEALLLPAPGLRPEPGSGAPAPPLAVFDGATGVERWTGPLGGFRVLR